MPFGTVAVLVALSSALASASSDAACPQRDTMLLQVSRVRGSAVPADDADSLARVAHDYLSDADLSAGFAAADNATANHTTNDTAANSTADSVAKTPAYDIANSTANSIVNGTVNATANGTAYDIIIGAESSIASSISNSIANSTANSTTNSTSNSTANGTKSSTGTGNSASDVVLNISDVFNGSAGNTSVVVNVSGNGSGDISAHGLHDDLDRKAADIDMVPINPHRAANVTAANGTGNSTTNGTTANGTTANGTANGTAANGTAVNGTAVNGTAVNGTAVNGTAVNGTGHGAANGSADGSDNVTGNSTGSSSDKGSACITREDTRISAFGYTTSPPGTKCVFGVDVRDEGEHCIQDNGQYGSYGWCFTSANRSSWGSCSEGCPLYGAAKVLEAKIGEVRRRMDRRMDEMEQTIREAFIADEPVYEDEVGMGEDPSDLLPEGDHLTDEPTGGPDASGAPRHGGPGSVQQAMGPYSA